MNTIAKVISLIGLVVTVVPCLLYYFGRMDHETVKTVALVGTILWFLSTPLWMGRRLPVDAKHVEI
ncbi:hypothetical protein Q31b_23810 [Novipirellula aureliae]|uniref:Uncharacterized protein n=1 Tax=Novipirellula aureliae TaxID=2527966 RepID=A0A5C6E346_9BACT|nr:hypothetical protein [Novipirellula aureliae]TWU43342.1 hypothetical protein Q31b_23810 [Novipirellula aureliae]